MEKNIIDPENIEWNIEGPTFFAVQIIELPPD
jgi:hypothetical protein